MLLADCSLSSSQPLCAGIPARHRSRRPAGRPAAHAEGAQFQPRNGEAV